MDQARDRTDIAPLLLEHFPQMAGATSEEWHAFLNETTGADVDFLEANASAFDKWRKALAAMDYPVWHITAAQADAMAARGKELVALASAARDDQAARTAKIVDEFRRTQAAQKAAAEKAAKGRG